MHGVPGGRCTHTHSSQRTRVGQQRVVADIHRGDERRLEALVVYLVAERLGARVSRRQRRRWWRRRRRCAIAAAAAAIVSGIARGIAGWLHGAQQHDGRRVEWRHGRLWRLAQLRRSIAWGPRRSWRSRRLMQRELHHQEAGLVAVRDGGGGAAIEGDIGAQTHGAIHSLASHEAKRVAVDGAAVVSGGSEAARGSNGAARTISEWSHGPESSSVV